MKAAGSFFSRRLELQICFFLIDTLTRLVERRTDNVYNGGRSRVAGRGREWVLMVVVAAR